MHRLSPRERELLKLAQVGLTDGGIGTKLGISPGTVNTYWQRIRQKLGPHSRTELVSMMVKQESAITVEALQEENALLLRELQSVAVHTNPHLESVLHGVIDSIPDALVVVLEDATIAGANEAASELFGYEHAELLRMELCDLMPERYREAHREHRRTYFEDPKRRRMGQHMETPALHKDGHEFPIRAALSTMTVGGKQYALCVVRDVD